MTEHLWNKYDFLHKSPEVPVKRLLGYYYYYYYY